jgi:hypothetical protein
MCTLTVVAKVVAVAVKVSSKFLTGECRPTTDSPDRVGITVRIPGTRRPCGVLVRGLVCTGVEN